MTLFDLIVATATKEVIKEFKKNPPWANQDFFGDPEEDNDEDIDEEDDDYYD